MKAMEYNVTVSEKGRVEFYVPFPAGSHIRLFVLEKPTDDNFDDLINAANSSTDFWDNPFDDEDWNNV